MRQWAQRAWPWLIAAALVSAVVTLGWLSQRYAIEATVAKAGELQLGENTRRLLARFQEPVNITAFVGKDSRLRGHVRQLLEAYRGAAPQVRVTIVDPKARPELVRELAVTRRGEVVVEYQGRRERAKAPTQARISAALERVLTQGDPYVAFVTGHGERDLLGLANFDLGQFGGRLQRKGYRLQPWRLGNGRSVPDNTSLLVVADPGSALSAKERSELADYIDRGGALLWLTEPSPSAGITALTELLGVRRRPGVLIDPSAGEMLAVDDPRLVLLGPELQHQAVTTAEDPLLLPRAAVLEHEATGAWNATPLLRAGPRARLAPLPWAPQGSPEQAEPAAGKALALGLSRSARAADGTREQRIAVVGDGDFLSNSYLGNAGNLPFGLNLIRWLLAEDTLMSTYQPATPDQKLSFSRTGQAITGLGFLLALPALLAFIGVWRWWRLRQG